MADEFHPVVQLLLARMKSHPEEFGGNNRADEYISRTEEDRWWQARTLVEDYGTEAEKEAVVAAMREIKLKVAHEWMMDELCNGDERRRREQEEKKRAYVSVPLHAQGVPYSQQLSDALEATNRAMVDNILRKVSE